MKKPAARFAHKVLVLVLSLILITGIGVAAASAIQLRRELFAREYSSAFTVYLAACNYLSAHYKSKGDRFVRSSLDFVLSEKFLRLEGSASELITHQPAALVVYDADGFLLYEYSADHRSFAAGRIPPEERPTTYSKRYDRASRQVIVAGPLSQDGKIPGTVTIWFPSTIERDIRAMLVQTAAILGGVCVVAMLMGVVFSSRVVRPITELTLAARRAQAGDLNQHVAVSTQDEIGDLARTFNLMMDSLVRRMSLMHRLQEWTVRISKQFDLDRLYVTVAEMFEVMAQSGFSRLYMDRGTGLKLERECGHPTAGRTGMAQRAFDSGRIQYLGRDGEIREEPVEPVEVAFPLVAGAKKVGAMHLGGRVGGGVYDEETLTTLSTLALHTATAMDNAVLYRELAERERVQREMQWARQIQRGLLPRAQPEVAGYEVAAVSEPALEVGGDYFDYLPVEGAWQFLVGDVSGKGVPAAIIMSIVRSLIHTHAEFASRPAEILRRVNRNLSPDVEAEMFVTMAGIQLNPGSHEITVVRAGHEPVLVLKADGRIARIAPGGAALALVDVAEFDSAIEEATAHLDAGDTVVMYTDGVTEAQNPDGEEFGAARLEALLSRYAGCAAGDLVNGIVQDVGRFVGGRAQYDDITVLAVRRSA